MLSALALRFRTPKGMMYASPLVAALSLTLVTSCDQAGEPVPIANWNADTLPTVVAEEDVRIGSLDDPADGFSRIGGIAETADGHVVVLEQQAREIRVYDFDGRVVNRFGGSGSGPGEFGSPGDMGFSGDTVWAYDYSHARLTVFRTDGTLLETVPGAGFRVNVPGANVRVVPDRPLGRGRFASRIYSASEGVTPTDSMRVPAVAFNEDGEVVDTTGVHFLPGSPVFQVAVQNFGVLVPQPLAEWPLVLGSVDDTVVVTRELPSSGDAAQFSITRILADGDTVSRTVISYTQTPVNADSVVAAMMRMNAGLPISQAAVEAKIREFVPGQRFHPPVLRSISSADGTLWLQREDPGGPETKWLIVDPLGTPRAHVLLPRRARVMSVSQDAVWAVMPDELDVPWVVRLRVELPPNQPSPA